MFRSAVSTLALIVFLHDAAFAQDACEGHFQEIPLQQKQATADIWANLRSSPGSLRFETGKLLKSGEVNAAQSKAPEDLCPPGCSAVRMPGYVLSTVPAKFLSGYATEDLCAKKKAATEAKPFQRIKRFADINELNDWFNDFSQGKGRDGKALYDECEGDCSPRYRTEITSENGTLNARVSVVCGHARDKSDNRYDLRLFAIWSCKIQ